MILLIYNELLDTMSINSNLKLFRDLPNYRNDVIVYKIFIHIKRKKYINDILFLLKKHNIKLIFCVFSCYVIKRTIPLYLSFEHNIVCQLNNLNLNAKILCHSHDFFNSYSILNSLHNINHFIESGFLENIKPFLPTKNIIPILHCATSNFIKDFNPNPINKILLSGDINHIVYPHRSHFYNYALNNPDKINIHNRTHFFNFDHNYPNVLNQHIACFFSSLQLNHYISSYNSSPILLAKVFEIPATGSLLLAHDSCETSLAKINFFNNINCILINENNYDSIINFILNPDNKSIIDNIRKNGQNLILNNHTQSFRISQINSILDSFIS
jgi:hypothetical protein